MENLNEEKTAQKKSKAWLWAIIVIVIIIAILVGGYFYYTKTTSASYIFTSQIDKAMDGLVEEEAYNTLNSTVSLSANIETENEEYAELAEYINDGKITLNVQTDYQQKTELLGFDVDYQDESLIAGNVYYADGDNNIYLYVNDLFDKYFKMSIDDIDESGELTELLKQSFVQATETDKANMDKANSIIKSEIKDKLKEEYFSQEKVDDTKKSTLNLTIGELKNIICEISTDLQNNEEFLKCYQNPTEIKDTLESLNTSLMEKTEYDYLNTDIAIYTKGFLSNNVVKLEISVYDDTDAVTFVVNKQDDKNYDFYLNIQKTENGMTANVETLNGTLKIEDVNENTKKCVFNVDVPDLGNVTVTMETSTIINGVIEPVDTKNSVDVNSLTDNDYMTIYTNLQSMRLYQLLAPMMIGY